MISYTYLLVNFFTIFICFIYSFDKRIEFQKHFKTFFFSSTLVAIPFILWDIYFTKKGIWWFDLQYTLGIELAGLPIEEWLFFFCIPFSCVFTYYCLNKFFDWSRFEKYNSYVSILTLLVCIIVMFTQSDKTYTLVTAIVTFVTVFYLHTIAKVKWLTQASIIFTILMLGFFPVNGVLTGSFIPSAIVNYNSNEFLNIRMWTIPIEDAVYGYSQFLLNIYFFKIFSKK